MIHTLLLFFFLLTRISFGSAVWWNWAWILPFLQICWPQATRSDVWTPCIRAVRNLYRAVCWTTPNRNRTLCPAFWSDCGSLLAWSSRPWPGRPDSWGPLDIRQWRPLCTGQTVGGSSPTVFWKLKRRRRYPVKRRVRKCQVRILYNRNITMYVPMKPCALLQRSIAFGSSECPKRKAAAENEANMFGFALESYPYQYP